MSVPSPLWPCLRDLSTSTGPKHANEGLAKATLQHQAQGRAKAEPSQHGYQGQSSAAGSPDDQVTSREVQTAGTACLCNQQAALPIMEALQDALLPCQAAGGQRGRTPHLADGVTTAGYEVHEPAQYSSLTPDTVNREQ